MAHLYRASEWQSESGKWYVNDVEELATVASKWYTPARMLGIALTDYILMLKNDFKAIGMSYYEPTDVLIFSFETQTDARKYKNWINAQARKANYIVGK